MSDDTVLCDENAQILEVAFPGTHKVKSEDRVRVGRVRPVFSRTKGVREVECSTTVELRSGPSGPSYSGPLRRKRARRLQFEGNPEVPSRTTLQKKARALLPESDCPLYSSAPQATYADISPSNLVAVEDADFLKVRTPSPFGSDVGMAYGEPGCPFLAANGTLSSQYVRLLAPRPRPCKLDRRRPF